MTTSTKLKIISTILSLTAIVGFLTSLTTMDVKMFDASSVVMVASLTVLIGSFLIGQDSRGEK